MTCVSAGIARRQIAQLAVECRWTAGRTGYTYLGLSERMLRPTTASLLPAQQGARLRMSNRFAVLAGIGEHLPAAMTKHRKNHRLSTVAASPSSAAAPTALTAAQFQDPLVWIDLEMTGLDVNKDAIIEIAVLVSDGGLDNVVEGPEIAIQTSNDVLENMNDWCVEHHGKSGLTQRCKDSTVALAAAEEQVLAFLKEHIQPGIAQLAGNSIHVDRMFLYKYMPSVVAYLHYRIVDVSTVKELSKVGRQSCNPSLHKPYPGQNAAHKHARH
jgi:oligoribonuclease